MFHNSTFYHSLLLLLVVVRVVFPITFRLVVNMAMVANNSMQSDRSVVTNGHGSLFYLKSLKCGAFSGA